VAARPDPLPLPEIPPRKREPIALRLKGAAPDSPPIGYLFGEPPADAPKPITVFPALLTYLTTDPQHFTEQLVQLVAKAWPNAGIISLSLCLDAELYSARLPARDDTPNPDPTAPTTQEPLP
jgi:hypothetical protein